MSLGLDGLNPLSYLGVTPTQPPQLVVDDRAPTTNDIQNFNFGTIWINKTTQAAWILTSLSAGVATWSQITGGPSGVTNFVTDSGTAVGAGGSINIITGANVITTGAGDTVTITLNGTTDHAVQIGNASGSLTSIGVGTTGQVLIGSTGADPAFGALGVNSNLTNHGVIVGQGNLALVATTPGTNGQVLTGATGADPLFQAIGTNSGLTNHGVILGQGNGAFVATSTGTAGQILASGGAGADPNWTTNSFPLTASQGDIIYASAANTFTTLAKDINATRYLSNTGASNNPAWAQVNLSNGVTGTLPVGNGGTGAITLTDHGVLVGSGTAAIDALAVGTTGQLLVGATGADPAFASSATGDFTFTSATANTNRILTVSNTDNTAAATSQATLQMTVGGGNVGDPKTTYTVTGVTNWTTGIDNSDSDKWKLSQGTALGTNDVMVAFVAGQVLKPLQPAFFATINAEANVTGDSTTHSVGSVTATTEVFDIGSNFNPGNGAGTPATFTAPVNGIYIFGSTIPFSSAAGGGLNQSTAIGVNGVTFYPGATFPTAQKLANFNGFNNVIQISNSIILQLSATNTVTFTVSSDGGAKVDDIAATGGQIWGALLF